MLVRRTGDAWALPVLLFSGNNFIALGQADLPFSRRGFMSTTPLVFHINGHEISATFAATKNEAANNHIKQILLSSFTNRVSICCSDDKLVSLQQQRYNKDSDSSHEP